MAKSKYDSYTHAQLVEELKKLHKRKKYGVVWEEEKTKEKFEAEAEGKLPVLVEDKKRKIKTDETKPTNILIEGDNYHALSVLNYTHAKSIDVIYIDPPYNTGAKDWKYNNDYVEEEDSYRHSKWLSFMNNRLKLAKKLLKPNGVLICTIDKHEQATLGLLLSEIYFDREIVCVTIIHNPAGAQGKNFSYTNEYAYFVYPKNGQFIGKTTREEDLVSPLRDWGTISKREEAKTCFYPIVVKDNKIMKFEDVCSDEFHPPSPNVNKKDGTIWIYPIDKHGIERKWVFSRKSVEKIIDQLFCKKIGAEYVIMRKKTEATYRTVWDDSRYYANVYGSNLLNKIIEAKFPFPKSLYAVHDCIKAVIHDKDDAVILDFFAGSGTTGHAVMLLNKEDEGKRQFILCTNNENNICEEITYPRIKNVIEGYPFSGTQKDLLYEKRLIPSLFDEVRDFIEEIDTVIEKNSKNYDNIEKKVADNTYRIYGTSKIKEFKQGLGGNLKYYKTIFVGSEPTHQNKKLLTKKSIEILCIKENTFDEVLTKTDISIFKNEKKFTAILFNEMKLEEFKSEIKKLKLPVSLYVFSLEADDFSGDFDDLKNDITFCSIPEAILKVYRRIYEAAIQKK